MGWYDADRHSMQLAAHSGEKNNVAVSRCLPQFVLEPHLMINIKNE
jgi:hypothetical protein